jgi:hypothetical protein
MGGLPSSVETNRILSKYALGGCDSGLATTIMSEMATHRHFLQVLRLGKTLA